MGEQVQVRCPSLFLFQNKKHLTHFEWMGVSRALVPGCRPVVSIRFDDIIGTSARPPVNSAKMIENNCDGFLAKYFLSEFTFLLIFCLVFVYLFTQNKNCLKTTIAAQRVTIFAQFQKKVFRSKSSKLKRKPQRNIQYFPLWLCCRVCVCVLMVGVVAGCAYFLPA